MTYVYLLALHPALRALPRWHSSARNLQQHLSGPSSTTPNPQFLRRDTVPTSRNLITVPDYFEPGASRPVERT